MVPTYDLVALPPTVCLRSRGGLLGQTPGASALRAYGRAVAWISGKAVQVIATMGTATVPQHGLGGTGQPESSSSSPEDERPNAHRQQAHRDRRQCSVRESTGEQHRNTTFDHPREHDREAEQRNVEKDALSLRQSKADLPRQYVQHVGRNRVVSPSQPELKWVQLRNTPFACVHDLPSCRRVVHRWINVAASRERFLAVSLRPASANGKH